MERARAYSKRLDASLAIIDKRRERANESEVMHLIGDVEGKDCIIVDDMIDTAGTLCNAARALHGPRRARASWPARPTASSRAPPSSASSILRSQRSSSPTSIPLSPEAAQSGKIKQISIARLLGEAIRRIHNSDSVSSLFV